MNSEYTVCFMCNKLYLDKIILNRSKELQIKKSLKSIIKTFVESLNITCFIVSMDNEMEIIFAETVVEVKKTYSNIFLECVIPFENNNISWKEKLRDRYYDVMSKCDKETLLQQRYTDDYHKNKNKYLISKSRNIILCKLNNIYLIRNHSNQKRRYYFNVDTYDISY